jgi:hypothetical protein
MEMHDASSFFDRPDWFIEADLQQHRSSAF